MGVDITFTFGHNLNRISMAEVIRRCDEMNDIFVEVARLWSQWYPHLGPPLQPWRDAGAFDVGQPFYMAPLVFLSVSALLLCACIICVAFEYSRKT